jgi:hypothetical protein
MRPENLAVLLGSFDRVRGDLHARSGSIAVTISGCCHRPAPLALVLNLGKQR